MRKSVKSSPEVRDRAGRPVVKLRGGHASPWVPRRAALTARRSSKPDICAVRPSGLSTTMRGQFAPFCVCDGSPLAPCFAPEDPRSPQSDRSLQVSDCFTYATFRQRRRRGLGSFLPL